MADEYLPDNPAAQLVEFLETRDAVNEGIAIADAIVEIAQVPNVWCLPAVMSALVVLPEKVERSIRQCSDIEHDLYLAWRPNISASFEHLIRAPQSPWREFKSKVDPTAVTGLKFCDERLSRESGRVRVRVDDLVTLHADVLTLMEDVLSNLDMDVDLRKVIIEHLSDIDLAITTYRISGIDGLREAALRTVGDIVVSDTKKHAENPLAQRFWAVIGKALVLIDLTKGAIELEQKILPTAALPPGPTVVVVSPSDQP